jgi:hypothetical protein
MVTMRLARGRELEVPEVDEKVMAFVEEALERDPDIPLAELYEETKKAIQRVSQLSKRQFNARYPLQVKRRRALAAKAQGRAGASPRASGVAGDSTRGAPATPSRDAIRQILLQFATDLAAAEERRDLVKVLAGVDRYVQEIQEALSGK